MNAALQSQLPASQAAAPAEPPAPMRPPLLRRIVARLRRRPEFDPSDALLSTESRAKELWNYFNQPGIPFH